MFCDRNCGGFVIAVAIRLETAYLRAFQSAPSNFSCFPNSLVTVTVALCCQLLRNNPIATNPAFAYYLLRLAGERALRKLLTSLFVLSLMSGTTAQALQMTAGCEIRKCTNGMPCADQDYAEQPLPSGSTIRGLSLSGAARMKQIDGPGTAVWQTKKLSWTRRYKLEQGCALVHAQRPVMMEAARATAFIDSGTSAVIHTDGPATRFVNLTDHHKNGMTVVFGNHYVDLDPGFELVLVKAGSDSIKTIAIHESIGWRDLQQIESDGLAIFVFRVSAADIMDKCKIYRQLDQSPLKGDQTLKEQLLKGVAALETMHNRKKGPFKLDPFHYGPDENQQTAAKSQPS